MSAVDVVAAVRRDSQGRYWTCRRTHDGSHGGLSGMWEYPGGRVEEGETQEVALAREMMEEFGVTIEIERPIMSIVAPMFDHDYRVNFFAVMFLDQATLRVHDRAAWCTVAEMLKQDHLPSGREFNARLALGKLVNADLLSDLQGAADHYDYRSRGEPDLVVDPAGLRRLRDRAQRLRTLHSILGRLTT